MTTIKPRLTVAIALFVLLGIAAAQAWRGRQIAGIAYGPGKAVVGRNRLVSYASDKSKMCDKTADEGFSHIEGYEDHNLHLLASYGQNGKITGVVINFACPPQSWENGWQTSTHYGPKSRQFFTHLLVQSHWSSR